MNTSWYAKSKSPTQAHILHFMDISIELKPSKSKHLRISITPTYTNHHLAPKITLSHHFQTPSHKLMDFLHLHKQWILSTHQKFLHQTQHINTILQSHKNQILLFGQWQEAPTKSALKITLHHTSSAIFRTANASHIFKTCHTRIYHSLWKLHAR